MIGRQAVAKHILCNGQPASHIPASESRLSGLAVAMGRGLPGTSRARRSASRRPAAFRIFVAALLRFCRLRPAHRPCGKTLPRNAGRRPCSLRDYIAQAVKAVSAIFHSGLVPLRAPFVNAWRWGFRRVPRSGCFFQSQSGPPKSPALAGTVRPAALPRFPILLPSYACTEIGFRAVMPR